MINNYFISSNSAECIFTPAAIYLTGLTLPFEMTLSAWPALKSLPAPVDNDKDGIPDDWEKNNGLNPDDASDAAKISLQKFYTNIEVYINSLLK